MKLASYEVDGTASYGLVVGDGIVDVGRRSDRPGRDLDQVVAEGRVDSLQRFQAAAPTHPADRVRWRPPLPGATRIYCVGVNYRSRAAEYTDDAEPSYPSIFMRTPGSFVGHGQPLRRPPESQQLDYEGEIAIVIGVGGRRVPEVDAEEHIAGITLVNEGTLRDWVRHGKFNVTPGKNFEASGGMGPWIVTRDEVGPLADLWLRTLVNDEVRQDAPISDMMFPIPYLISYISTFARLHPGDIIVTGTPPGAGARLDPPRYLEPGDRVDVEVEGIGTLTNGVIDEP